MNQILIDAQYENETRVVVIDNDGAIQYFDYEVEDKKQIKSNIYLAKINKVEPSLQAAFIDYGGEKNGFLPFNEVSSSYYQISNNSHILELQKIQDNNYLDSKENSKNNKTHYFDYNLDDINLSRYSRREVEEILMKQDPPEQEEDIENIVEQKTLKENFSKNLKIQDVLKKDQLILVQAQKEERGDKGASFSSYIFLVGKYCILMPNKPNQSGVSRRIFDKNIRSKLKNFIKELLQNLTSNSASIILRTASEAATTYELKRDYNYLVNLWNKIHQKTLNSNVPCFIHMEENIIHRAVRDKANPTISRIVIQGNSGYLMAKEFIKNLMPEYLPKLKEYSRRVSMFSFFGIEEKLVELYKPIVLLKSGGSIVINPTEALTAIDVNSGKDTSERNIEETAFRTNLEAGQEVIKQILLRNISGLIVIDFIDMEDENNIKLLHRALLRYSRYDRAKIHIGNLSRFGLIEMSRQRIGPSFLEYHSNMCLECEGKGVVRSSRASAMLILRTVTTELDNKNVTAINIYAGHKSILFLLNYRREEILEIEKRHNVKLAFLYDEKATQESFTLEKFIQNNKKQNLNTRNISSGNTESEEVKYKNKSDDTGKKSQSYNRRKDSKYIKDEQDNNNEETVRNIKSKKNYSKKSNVARDTTDNTNQYSLLSKIFKFIL